MNNITFKRKGRKSMLGTRQFKPPPIEPITEKSFSEENDALFEPSKPIPRVIEDPVKEVPLEKPTVVLNQTRTEELSVDESAPIQEDELIIKAVRKNLICSLFPADDSFEANETMLANNSFNETVLATTLLMSAKKSEDSVLVEKNNEICKKKKEDETLQQVLETVSLLLKKNAEAMENNRQEREILMEMKNRICEKMQK